MVYIFFGQFIVTCIIQEDIKTILNNTLIRKTYLYELKKYENF